MALEHKNIIGLQVEQETKTTIKATNGKIYETVGCVDNRNIKKGFDLVKKFIEKTGAGSAKLFSVLYINNKPEHIKDYDDFKRN